MAFRRANLGLHITTMRLIFRSHSPYARKVLVTAHELSLIDGIELIEDQGGSLGNDDTFLADPFGNFPVLVCNDGMMLFESVVICEYLDELQTGTSLIPSADPHRWLALRLQALAHRIADTGIALRWETEQQAGASGRLASCDDGRKRLIASYDFLEKEVDLSGRVDIGQIALATALNWIDFHQVSSFRDARPKLTRWYDAFAQRPSMQATGYRRESYNQ